MMRPVDHSAMHVAGFTTPWHADAGECFALSLSTDVVVRDIGIRRLDTPVVERMPWPIHETGDTAIRRSLRQGSFLRITAAELEGYGEIRSLAFELFLTRNTGSRCILEIGRIALRLDDGAVVLAIDRHPTLETPPVPAGQWFRIDICFGHRQIALKVISDDLLAAFAFQRAVDCADLLTGGQDIVLGASGGLNDATLNARFAALTVETRRGHIAWNFPTLLPDALHIISSGAGRLRLDLVNQPTFFVTSRRWDGTSFDPRLTPTHCDAIHYHDDDIGPLNWPASYTVTVPSDATPGIYAFEVCWDDGQERIVFFVTSNQASRPLVYLVPTATYLAYADERLPEHLYAWKCDDRGHRFAVANGFQSLYDFHSDFSETSICSYRKPKATVRDDYNYPLCVCPHNLPVDLHFLRFANENGFEFDFITDHDLHHRGIVALNGHSAIVTGRHPEYISVEIEAALRAFASSGGSIAYLGGNGFAGIVAFKDDLMELRRSPLEAGRTWDGPVAEQSLSITNEPGGHLRARGRGEFSLIGGAISLMGFDQARPFTRTAASHLPEQAWLFEQTESDIFGSDGIVLGGAAGYEVDCTNLAMGTAPDTVVVARATGFPKSFVHDETRWYGNGETEKASHRCAEMTVRYLRSTGLILSASSVAWCGALPVGRTMNDVGKITLNLLKRISVPGGSMVQANQLEGTQ